MSKSCVIEEEECEILVLPEYIIVLLKLISPNLTSTIDRACFSNMLRKKLIFLISKNHKTVEPRSPRLPPQRLPGGSGLLPLPTLPCGCSTLPCGRAITLSLGASGTVKAALAMDIRPGFEYFNILGVGQKHHGFLTSKTRLSGCCFDRVRMHLTRWCMLKYVKVWHGSVSMRSACNNSNSTQSRPIPFFCLDVACAAVADACG